MPTAEESPRPSDDSPRAVSFDTMSLEPKNSPRSPRPPLQQSLTQAEKASRKTIYLIRHGNGLHNSKAAKLREPSYLDCMLDPIGEHQAVQLGIRYRREVRNGSRPVELVVSSPLTRCMQTAHYAFGIGASSEHQFPTAAPPMLVHDDLREATGEYYSDKRRTKTELKESFPSFDFDDDMVEEDGLWRSDKRESMTEISRRISKFFAWLGDRPETKIAVVTHGLIIETAIRKYCPKYLPGRTRVLTCDVYRCSCIGVAHDDERMDVSGCIIQKAVLQSNLSRAQDDERDYDTNING